MTTVLVTRPGSDGTFLCQQLEQAGVRAVHQPLIEFSRGCSAPELADALSCADIVIAVSKPAVQWSRDTLADGGFSWPKTPLYLAVGQKTADKLSEITQQKVHCPSVSDSEHLLALPQLQQVTGRRVVILRGNGGRELIRSELMEKGALVQYCEVYQRSALAFDGHCTVKDWQQRRVNRIVVTSAEQLSILKQSVPEIYLNWLQRQTLLVPSERIAVIATDMGFQHVKVTGSASNPEIIATILSLSTTG